MQHKKSLTTLLTCLSALFLNVNVAQAGTDPTILGVIKLNKTSISQLKKNLPASCKVKTWNETMYEIEGKPCFSMIGDPEILIYTTQSPRKTTNDITSVRFNFFPSSRKELLELSQEYLGILEKKYGPSNKAEANTFKWKINDTSIELEVMMPSEKWNSLMLTYHYIGLKNQKKSHTENLL